MEEEAGAMKAEIIAVGTEILLGDIVNTNAQFISKELSMLGIDVYNQSVVGDNEDRILKAFEEAFKRVDIIITSGGLGPTEDDLTKETAVKYFGMTSQLHEESLKCIKDYFYKINKKFNKNNIKQAYFPKEAIILNNPNGTAPGAILSKDEKTIIVLPGPPKELKPMFLNSVRPYLLSLSEDTIISTNIKIIGIGESEMEEKVKHIILRSSNPTVAPYAKENNVLLRVTAKGKNTKEANELIYPVVEEIKSILGDNIFTIKDENLEDVVAKLLIKNKLTISTAESCTGGLVAATLINYPGISEVFLEGIVTYSNESKINNLQVQENTLEKYGAVSEETAKEMALGVCEKVGTDVSIATTGIAGPGGGSDEKPIGLVYIAVAVKGEVTVKRCVFNGDREKVRARATNTALDILRRELLRYKNK